MQSDNNDLLEYARTHDGELPADQMPPRPLPQAYRTTPISTAENPRQYWVWVLMPSILLLICLALYWAGNIISRSRLNAMPTAPFYSDIQFLNSHRSAIISPNTGFEDESCWVTIWPDGDEVPVFTVTETEIRQTGILGVQRVEVYRPTRISGWYQLAEYYPDQQGQGVVVDDYFTGVCEAN